MADQFYPPGTPPQRTMLDRFQMKVGAANPSPRREPTWEELAAQRIQQKQAQSSNAANEGGSAANPQPQAEPGWEELAAQKIKQKQQQEAGDKNFLQKTKEFFTGDDRQTDKTKGLKEFDLPFEFSARQAKTALGLLTTFDPKRQVNILKENYPKLAFEEDEKGNIIVDGQAYGAEKGVLNMPGISGRDLLQAGFQVAAFTPAAKAAGLATGPAGKSALVGVASGATQAGQDLISQSTGATQRVSPANVDVGDVAIASVAGGGSELIFGAIAKRFPAFVQSLKGSKDMPVNVTPEMRTAFRDAALKEGVDPAVITDDLVQDFVTMAKQGISPKNMKSTRNVRQAENLTNEFGIPFTKGQMTQDVANLNLEDSLRHGGLTNKGQAIVSSFDAAQARQINKAGQTIQSRLSGAASPQVETVNQSMELVGGAIKDKAAAAESAIQAAYSNAAGKSAALRYPDVESLAGGMRSAIKERVVDLGGNSLTPATKGALNTINDFVTTAEGSAKQGGATGIKDIEFLRRKFNQYIDAAANPTDKANIVIMKRHLDGFVDDAVEKALFVGDDDAISALKEARALRADYARKFQANPRTTKSGSVMQDDAGKVMERIVESNPTNEEIANYLFGSAKIAKGSSQRIAAKMKDVLGESSPEWHSVREAAFLKLTTNDAKGAPISAKMFNKRLNDAVFGSGESFMKELFTPAEMNQFRRFASAVSRTQPEIGNPSKTSYKQSQIFRQAVTQLTSRLGFATGDINMLAASKGIEALGNRAATKAAERSVKGIVHPLQDVNPLLISGSVTGAVAGAN